MCTNMASRDRPQADNPVGLRPRAKIFLGSLPEEACKSGSTQFFATGSCRHSGEYKKHRRVINTSSNFFTGIPVVAQS